MRNTKFLAVVFMAAGGLLGGEKRCQEPFLREMPVFGS